MIAPHPHALLVQDVPFVGGILISNKSWKLPLYNKLLSKNKRQSG